MTQNDALRDARGIVSPIFGVRYHYTFKVFDIEAMAWRETMAHRTHAQALIARRRALVQCALIFLGADRGHAAYLVEGENGTARAILARLAPQITPERTQ